MFYSDILGMVDVEAPSLGFTTSEGTSIVGTPIVGTVMVAVLWPLLSSSSCLRDINFIKWM